MPRQPEINWKKKTPPKYTYPEGLRPWMVEPFPIDVRKKFVALARRLGRTTPDLLEEVVVLYMQTHQK